MLLASRSLRLDANEGVTYLNQGTTALVCAYVEERSLLPFAARQRARLASYLTFDGVTKNQTKYTTNEWRNEKLLH